MANESTGHGPGIDPERDPLLKTFDEGVKASYKKWSDVFDEARRNRQILKGAIPDDIGLGGESSAEHDNTERSGSDRIDPRKKVLANLGLATNEALLPLLYARNPDVAIRPSERVGTEGEIYTVVRAWAQTLEIIVSQQLRTGGLKDQAKKQVRSVQAAKVGWLKVTYQRDLNTDPEIANRMNDAQDNLTEVQGLIADLSDGDESREELEAKAEQLQGMIEGLQNSPEVALAQGIVVDFIPMDQMRMDPSISCVLDYKQAAWMAHYTMISVQEYRDRFQLDNDEGMRGVKGMRGVNVFYENERGKQDSKPYGEVQDSYRDQGMVRLWERWNRSDNRIYTWADGALKFAREPFAPQGLGERWYPFFLLGFHWIDGEEFPEATIELSERLVQEYNDTRQQRNEHRKANIPHYIGGLGDLTPDSVKSFTIAGAREIVLLDTNGRPLKEIIQPSPQIPMNHQMYDTTYTLADIQWVSGLQDAARGGVVKAKTLGEAEIAQNHLASRIGNYQDELEEMLTDLATYVAQIVLQKMPPELVKKIAGENAVWPQLERSDVFELFDLEIRAGSTGKPDKREEQEQWGTLLEPMLQLIERILQMRQGQIDPQTGQYVVPPTPDAQNPYVAMLEETLKRFDERLDLEQFLPPMQQQQQAGPQGLVDQGGNPMQSAQAGGPPGTGIPPELQQQIMAAGGGGLPPQPGMA